MYNALPTEYQEMWKKYGRRNIANTTTAPVGTISTLLDSTSGCEPLYMISEYLRRRKVDPRPGVRVDFVDETGDSWQEYKMYPGGVQQWVTATGNADVTKSPYYGACANDIDWDAGVRLQAAAQFWVCHSISRTANMPKSASHEAIATAYFSAWKSGCKGFTVYRDGSRSGVLLSDKLDRSWYDGIPDVELTKMISTYEKHKSSMPSSYRSEIDQARATLAVRSNTKVLIDESDKFEQAIIPHINMSQAKKRPKALECDIRRVRVMTEGESETYIVLIGLLEGKPYEIFCGLSKMVDIPRKYDKGAIIKQGRKKPGNIATYNLTIGKGDDEFQFKDIVELFDNPAYGSFSRILSLCLRHELPIQFVVEQLQKDKYSTMASWTRAISRVIKEYIPDGTKSSSDKECPDCHSNSLVYQQGCVSCMSCNYSKCA
jgi:ribonucleoside-diphosphate reductase alpha chain